jgi:carotenoid cleavage dioxygenase-like enzyme
MDMTALEETRYAGPQAGYRSLHDEVTVTGLEVQGQLPAWLRGSLLRNGPGLYEAGDRSVQHWFDGQAMLHRFTIGDGAVSYANRFLRTAPTKPRGRASSRSPSSQPIPAARSSNG